MMNHYSYKFKLLLVPLILLSTSIVYAENQKNADFPLYDGTQLVVPRVDTVERAGVYQSATFVYDSKINAWHLKSFDQAREDVAIEYVIPSVIVTSTPAQVLLQVKGEILSCGSVGRIDQRIVNNKFEIRIYATKIPSDSTCLAATVPFLKVIPLDVYGLDAGTYEYSINGGTNGTFELLKDNRLAECEGIGQCNLITTLGSN